MLCWRNDPAAREIAFEGHTHWFVTSFHAIDQGQYRGHVTADTAFQAVKVLAGQFGFRMQLPPRCLNRFPVYRARSSAPQPDNDPIRGNALNKEAVPL